MGCYNAIKSLETIGRDLEVGNLCKAEGTLQKSHKYFQELVLNDFCNSSSEEEVEIVSHLEQIHIEDAPWNSRNGAVLLAQESCGDAFGESLFVRTFNVFGALALKACHFDISVNAFEKSAVHSLDQPDDKKSNVSIGIAHNNLGCVHISKGCFQKAKENFETALKKFKIIKNSTNANVVQQYIVTVLNNLRQVHQAQRNCTAEEQVRNELFTILQEVSLPPRIVAVVEFNEACASLENRNLEKALNEFKRLKSFCETELPQSEQLIKCISLKMCLVYRLQGNSSKAAEIIDTEILTLPELIELLNVDKNCPLDFSITIAETLVDICVNQGNLDVACELLAYLVTVCRKKCGPNHPIFAVILQKQGMVFSLMGKTDSSRQCLTTASQVFTRTFGAVHPDILKCEKGLARLESSDGLQGKSLLHSQRVLENVEKIYQVSFMDQLRKRFVEKFEHSRMLIPETNQEENLKLEGLISEYGVEIVNVLSQHQPSDLGDHPVLLPEITNRQKVPVSGYPEEICAKLSFNFLKTGLWLFNLGMVSQSTVFLLLSCTYTEMFHSHSDCSDVMLVRAILVLYHLKVRGSQGFPIEERLRNEFKVLRNYIEGRFRQHVQTKTKCLFFEEIVNLKVSLALFLRSFAEMEMFDMIEVIQELFSDLQYHHLQKVTNIFLAEELRFVFFSSKIECLGRVASHNLIFTTPFTLMHKVLKPEEKKTSDACQLVMKDQNSFHKSKTSKGQPINMVRTLALKSSEIGKIPFERFCRFVVHCPVSNEVDIAALNQINDCSLKSMQDIAAQLVLRKENQVTPTQYVIELEPLVYLESDLPLLLGDLSLLPLILSPANEDAKLETKPSIFINAAKTCKGTVTFTFPDRATSTFLFEQLVKQIFTNLEKLAENADVEIADGHLVLKIQCPWIGQIVMKCVDDSIEIKTQLMYAEQSPTKREIYHEEMPPCNCTIIDMFFAEEMERCAGRFGIAFEERIEKAWCIASLPHAEEMGHKTLEDKDKLSLPSSPSRLESHRETSHLNVPYEEYVLSESCTQTDSLSLPITSEFGTQTDESVSSPHLENPTVTDASETTSDDIPAEDMLTAGIKLPEDKGIGPHDKCGDMEEDTPKESTPDESESVEKINRPPFVVPRRLNESKLERHKGDENETMVSGGASEIKHDCSICKERHKCPEGVEFPNTEQHPVKLRSTDDWQGDATDSTVNPEMADNEKPRCDVSDISSYSDQANAALQDYFPFSSSLPSAKSPFKGGDVVADDSPRQTTDQKINDYVDVSNNCNTNSGNSTTSLQAVHETNCRDVGLVGAGRITGLNEGHKDQFTTNWIPNDTLKLEPSPSWNQNQGAKPKAYVQRTSDVLSSKNRTDKENLLDRVDEPAYFGIRPVFLARHTDDNSISMTCDDEKWNMEDTEERPSDILSRYQRFGCYPDRSYHTPSTCPPRLPLSQHPGYSAMSQGPILGTAPSSTGNVAYLNPNEQRSHGHSLYKKPAYPGYAPSSGVYPMNPNVSIWNLPPPPPLPSSSIPFNESAHHHTLLNDERPRAVQSRSPQVSFTTPSSTSQPGGIACLGNTGLTLPNNAINPTGIGQSAVSVSPTQNVASLQAEASSTIRQHGRERTERQSNTAATKGETSTVQPGLLNSNSHISDDDSLAALERRVAEACSLVERVLKEREEREKAMKERERRKREERARRELREQERREKEARETRERNQSGVGASAASEEESPSQNAALPENPQWLCEHYQRLCRVRFSCCGRYYPCHRCHNNSGECANDSCKAKEAFYIECSICRHQQPINQAAQTCARCNTKMSAYFCSICKHFTGEDKYPYHCTKCGICRIHKDRSFHCDVCNVCLDKRLQGKHKCRADSGHDECCICLEDAFSGCQILPCSHKVHRECAIAMIQNGVRSCPICRHPLYSQTGGTE